MPQKSVLEAIKSAVPPSSYMSQLEPVIKAHIEKTETVVALMGRYNITKDEAAAFVYYSSDVRALGVKKRLYFYDG